MGQEDLTIDTAIRHRLGEGGFALVNPAAFHAEEGEFPVAFKCAKVRQEWLPFWLLTDQPSLVLLQNCAVLQIFKAMPAIVQNEVHDSDRHCDLHWEASCLRKAAGPGVGRVLGIVMRDIAMDFGIEGLVMALEPG